MRTEYIWGIGGSLFLITYGCIVEAFFANDLEMLYVLNAIAPAIAIMSAMIAFIVVYGLNEWWKKYGK